MEIDIVKSLQELIDYSEAEKFAGYDPYDVLNSKLLRNSTNYLSALLIQVQKRNPINIRPLLGIGKEYNPKAIGLLLKSCALNYQRTGEKRYLDNADILFQWLAINNSKGYSGKCWGYNFNWSSPGSFLPAYTPSVVVTSFICDGIFEYYKLTGNPDAKEILTSAADYIDKDIQVVSFSDGIAFSYTHIKKDCCYNASLLAAEILAKADFVNNSAIWTSRINRAIDFALSKQKADGEWYYSYDLDSGAERRQIDFHQGFILVSLNNLYNLLKSERQDMKSAIEKGLLFYRDNQFNSKGRSFWRIPSKWPVDIHHQSQGIITFCKLKKFDQSYFSFAEKIAEYTIRNMRSDKGYFYFRKYPLITNKISYMRWAQAWMMLALSELLANEKLE